MNLPTNDSMWSDDCLSCLCNLPHSVEDHNKAVERASAELQEDISLFDRGIVSERRRQTKRRSFDDSVPVSRTDIKPFVPSIDIVIIDPFIPAIPKERAVVPYDERKLPQ